MADLIQLFGVLGLQGGHVFRKGLAQLFQLLGVGGLQTLEPLGQDLLLAASGLVPSVVLMLCTEVCSVSLTLRMAV